MAPQIATLKKCHAELLSHGPSGRQFATVAVRRQLIIPSDLKLHDQRVVAAIS
jgi:hypothetical protein